MATARYWSPPEGREGEYIPGVPAADLSDEEWALLHERQQRSVDASGLYRKTRPPQPAKPKKVASEAEPTPAAEEG